VKHARIGMIGMFAGALLVLFVAPAAMAQGFPGPGPLSMKSGIELPLYINGSFAESVTFNSALTVNMGKAYETDDGIRQVDFVATSWKASGFSQVLGRQVTFTLTPNATQPTGTATALTTGSDFPAVLTFRALYDANVQGLTTLRGLRGLATGTVNSIPPGQSGLNVNKAFAFSDGLNQFEFRGGKCAHTSVHECEPVVAVPPPVE
jgi:hypothetical protein